VHPGHICCLPIHQHPDAPGVQKWWTNPGPQATSGMCHPNHDIQEMSVDKKNQPYLPASES